MAGKFLSIEEAASQLKVSVDEVNRLVDRKELFPLRDGATLKFKTDEISRLAEDRAAEEGGAGGGEEPVGPLEIDLAGSGVVGPNAGGSGGLSFDDELVFDDVADAPDGSRTLLGGPEAGAADSSPSLPGPADDAGSMSLFDDEAAPPPSSKPAGSPEPAPVSSLDDLSLDGLVLDPPAELPAEATVDLAGAAAAGGSGLAGLSGAGSAIGGALSGLLDSGLSLEKNDVAGSGIDLAIGSDIGGAIGTSGIDLGGSDIGGKPGGSVAAGSVVLGSGIGGSVVGGKSLVGDAFDLGGAEDDSGSVVVATESTGDSSFFGTVGDDSASVSFDDSASSGFSSTDVPMDGEFVIETTFGAWQIVGLACCSLILLFAGFIMFDLAWTIRAPGGRAFSAPLLEGLASTFGWTK